jgi:hypothetical protein
MRGEVSGVYRQRRSPKLRCQAGGGAWLAVAISTRGFGPLRIAASADAWFKIPIAGDGKRCARQRVICFFRGRLCTADVAGRATAVFITNVANVLRREGSHLITNIRLTHPLSGLGDGARTTTRCRFIVYRNRLESETDFLLGRREDTLTRVHGELKIARRKIVLDLSVLLAKHLTMFF